MAYQKQIWENLPSTNTPLSADRLNHMEDGIYEAYEHGGGGETLPVGSEIDYDGQTVPTGWEQVDDVPEYSTTDEIVCGTWIDGKTIYRKTIYVESLPNATSQDIQHNISNVDKIWCDMSNSFIKWNTSTGNSPFNYIGGTSFNSMIEIRAFTTTKFTIDTHSTDRSSLSAYITINYTKTTD